VQRFLPRLPGPRSARLAAGVLTLGALAVGGGWWLRDHAIASLQVAGRDGHALVFLAPLDVDDRACIAALVGGRLGGAPRLVYVAPAHWSVPELGLAPSAGYANDGMRELAHPASHGNAGGYASGIRALVARPHTWRPADGGRDLLAATVRMTPLHVLDVDPAAGSVSPPAAAAPSAWGDIPVPVY